MGNGFTFHQPKEGSRNETLPPIALQLFLISTIIGSIINTIVGGITNG